ncbi:MAG: 50S ribosomal protein L29 [Bacillota bacterium]
MKADQFELLKQSTSDELNLKLNDFKEELFNLRFQLATGQLGNKLRVKEVRKNIARIKTILHERTLQAERKG